MILFLDTVSPLPEFCLIEDNKIIYSNQILSNQSEKMSDLLIPSYMHIEQKFNLNSKLQLLIINTGPGSYTALRVGISFFSAISLSKNLNFIGISCADLFRFIIPSNELTTSGIYISSSNDQHFIGFFDIKLNKFKIKKIEKNISLNQQDIHIKSLDRIYINENSHENKKKIPLNIKIKEIKFSNIVSNNIKKIKDFKNNDIIEPIYCSNNKILN